MSTEPFIGEVKIFGFQFAPISYNFCNGALMSIAQYTALYSLIGTTYGGDGQTTFALPDLRGRVPISQGKGAGLPDYVMGEAAGSNTAMILPSNLPQHIHTLNSMRVSIKASTANAGESSPDGTVPAVTTGNAYADAPSTGVNTGGATVAGTTDLAGMSQPIYIQDPFLAINYSIAIEGIFPSRN